MSVYLEIISYDMIFHDAYEMYDLSCLCGIHYICDMTLTCNRALHCICIRASHFMGVSAWLKSNTTFDD